MTTEVNLDSIDPPKRIFEKQQGYYLDPKVLDAAGESDDGIFEHARVKVPLEDANLVSSESGTNPSFHRPVLDIDLPCELIPSSTPGKFHLYIDCPMTWVEYEKLLRALERARILESGYVNASIERKATMLRKPGVYKPNSDKRSNYFPKDEAF